MTYADSTEVTRKIEQLDVVSTIDSNILDDAIVTADELVNAELVETTVDQNSPPNSIVKAATLLAQAEYLDGLTSLGDNRSPTAIAWTEKAYKIISGWLNEHQESQAPGGYSRGNTSKYRPFHGNKNYRPSNRRKKW
jgi:hypothetical protein